MLVRDFGKKLSNNISIYKKLAQVISEFRPKNYLEVGKLKLDFFPFGRYNFFDLTENINNL